MVTPAIAARDALRKRLEAVFSAEVMDEVYPDARVPSVYLGYPVNEPPCYVAVDEIVDTAQSSGAATMGHAQLDFTLNVWLFARNASLVTAANTLLCYIDAVFGAVLADQRLDFTVDNSFPRVLSAGTAADSSKYYMAAASVAVECSVYSQCPRKLQEVVHATNSNK